MILLARGLRHGRRRLVCCLVVALAASMFGGVGADAAPTWTVRTLPATAPDQPHAKLLAVSCPSLTYCLAVGSHVTLDGSLAPLAEAWNGRTWRVVTQSVPGSDANGFTAVSCVNRRFCLATTSGATVARPLRWNGTSWRVLSLGSAYVTSLADITCKSSKNCTAVGSIDRHPDGSDTPQAASWRWNGETWRRISVAYPYRRSLDSVSCPSTTLCYAGGTVDYAKTNVGTRAFVARYDGHSWKAAALPKIDGSFSDISCRSTTRCTAVGTGGSDESVLLADLYNGTWHYGTINTKKYAVGATRVACTAAGTCTAIVSYFNAEDAVVNAIAVRPRSGTFAIAARAYNDLSGLSCAGTGCTVVGSTLVTDRSGFTIAAQPTPATAYRRSGTSLARQPVPQPPGRATNDLTEVSCAGAGVCAALGSVDEEDTTLWLRKGSGAAWQSVAGVAQAGYTDVACSSATFCMAVGQGTSRSYNGTSWTAHTIPKPQGKNQDEIYGVSCVSPTWCDAVGTTSEDVSVDAKAFVVHWNGVHWSVATAPSPGGTASSALNAISCTSTTACLAVGSSETRSFKPLVERWDGTSWTIVANTGLPATTQLADVSCWSATGCLVISDPDADTAAVGTWNGSSFTSRPFVGDQPSINAVSCRSATSCTAAGLYFGANRYGSQLIEHFDGTSWRAVATPQVDGYQPVFYGVSCAGSDGRCTAVGAVDRAYTVALVATGPAS